MSALTYKLLPTAPESRVNTAVIERALDSSLASADEMKLAQLIVVTLNLEVTAAEIAPAAALYGGEGLGLDSIDILELALAISKTYGFQLRSDGDNNRQIFSSLRSLNEYIRHHRTA